MNKDNAKDYLPLVQALADGKTIQVRQKSSTIWRDIYLEDREIYWDADPDQYRIKPEPWEGYISIMNSGSTIVSNSFGSCPAGAKRTFKVREVTDEQP